MNFGSSPAHIQCLSLRAIVTLLVNLLTAALLVVTTPSLKQDLEASSSERIFSPFRQFADFTLSVDLDSLDVKDGSTDPKILLDIELKSRQPKIVTGVPRPVSSYVYSLQIRCKTDEATVIVSRLFDENGVMMKSIGIPFSVKNPKTPTSPMSVIIDFTCRPFREEQKGEKWDRYKGFEPKPGVTPSRVPRV